MVKTAPIGGSLRPSINAGNVLAANSNTNIKPVDLRQPSWYIGMDKSKVYDDLGKSLGTYFEQRMDVAIKEKAKTDGVEAQRVEEQQALAEGRPENRVEPNGFFQFFNPDAADAFQKSADNRFLMSRSIGIKRSASDIATQIATDNNIPVAQKAQEYNKRFDAHILNTLSNVPNGEILTRLTSQAETIRANQEAHFLGQAVAVHREQQFQQLGDEGNQLAVDLLTSANVGGETYLQTQDELVDWVANLRNMNPTNAAEVKQLDKLAADAETAMKVAGIRNVASGMSIAEQQQLAVDLRNGKDTFMVDGQEVSINFTSIREVDAAITDLNKQIRERQTLTKVARADLKDDIRDAKVVISGNGRTDIDTLVTRAQQLDPTGEFGISADVEDLVALDAVQDTVTERGKMSSGELRSIMEQDAKAEKERKVDTLADVKLKNETRKIFEENRKAELSFDVLSLADKRLELGLETADEKGMLKDAPSRAAAVKQARSVYGNDKVLFYTKAELDAQRKTYANANAAGKQQMLKEVVGQFYKMGIATAERELPSIVRAWAKLDPGMAYIGHTIREQSKKSQDILERIQEGMEQEENAK